MSPLPLGPPRPPNPFTAHFTLTTEDYLTEWIAAALRGSSEFRGHFAKRLLGAHSRWTDPRIRSPRDVAIRRGTSSGRPDLLLTVHARDATTGKVRKFTVACEHKLTAQETRAGRAKKGRPRAQLERYLQAKDIHAVLYVRWNLKKAAELSEQAWWKGLSPSHKRKLIQPAPTASGLQVRWHFLWTDVGEALQRANHDARTEVIDWLVSGFRERGWIRADIPPAIGDIHHSNRTKALKARARFQEMIWDHAPEAGRRRVSVSDELGRRGWKVSRSKGTNLTLRAIRKDKRLAAYQVQIRVGFRRSSLFEVRVTARGKPSFELLLNRIRELTAKRPEQGGLFPTAWVREDPLYLRRRQRLKPVLILQADINEFNDGAGLARYRKRLRSFVLRTLDALAVDPVPCSKLRSRCAAHGRC